jgi:hypothetical protein
MPDAALILAVLGPMFLGLAVLRTWRSGWPPPPAARTWFLVGTIFCIVATYLWYTQGRG